MLNKNILAGNMVTYSRKRYGLYPPENTLSGNQKRPKSIGLALLKDRKDHPSVPNMSGIDCVGKYMFTDSSKW